MDKLSRIRLWNCTKAGIFGLFLNIIPSMRYAHVNGELLILGFLTGFLIGVFELFVYRERLRKLNFFLGLLIKAISYSISSYIIILLFLSITSWIAGGSLFGSMLSHFMGEQLFFNLLQSFYVAIFILFLFQLDELLGDGVFRRYVFGKYHRPTEQTLIFMFLDIKNSTAMAEQMGDKKHYKLLDDFFHHISRPVVNYQAEIYKYVGDEVILKWNAKRGIDKANCINFFFSLKRRIEKKSKYYKLRYGIVPEFKAGMHIGHVVSALIGGIRKEIVFNGDVLNTASRLEKKCSAIGKDLLISTDLYQKLPEAPGIQYNFQGKIELKGKKMPLGVYAVDSMDSKTTNMPAKQTAKPLH